MSLTSSNTDTPTLYLFIQFTLFYFQTIPVDILQQFDIVDFSVWKIQ